MSLCYQQRERDRCNGPFPTERRVWAISRERRGLSLLYHHTAVVRTFGPAFIGVQSLEFWTSGMRDAITPSPLGLGGGPFTASPRGPAPTGRVPRPPPHSGSAPRGRRSTEGLALLLDAVDAGAELGELVVECLVAAV